ncbi:MAG TPA: alkaline phosphatase family protein [Kofleriaceae bacterium]|nr:alkaline phosphatase family protein [Kofleriaceae bacterium]
MKRLVVFLTGVLFVSCVSHKAVDLFASGGVRHLRDRPDGLRPSGAGAPVLILALDGAGRDQLYGMLRAGELPNLAALLGGDGFAHAYLDEDVLSVFPSITMAAWTSMMTNATPADDGIPGNEFFIRDTREFVALAPISFVDNAPTLEIYSDGYLDRHVEVPTIYERIHERDPGALIWVSLHQIARGADDLFLTKRSALLDAAKAFASDKLDGKPSRDVYAALDENAIAEVAAKLDSGTLPDVVTIYLPGLDSYAHTAAEGPDAARRTYLREVIDPALRKLVVALQQRGALANRWVIVTADHGHTEVLHDDHHAIAPDLPKAALEHAGFHVRAFQRKVADQDAFSAVVAYGGPTAFVYLADRSRCAALCDWHAPARYREDVLPAADAFWRANADGSIVPALRDTLDLILVREGSDHDFRVYVGEGKTQALDEYLAAHPHPTYVDFAPRLHALAVGAHGDRAGDILLLSHDGDRDDVAQRHYFAAPYRSFHGSPSRRDSEIPLIVASPRLSSEAVKASVDRVLGAHPTITKVGALILALRAHPPQP